MEACRCGTLRPMLPSGRCSACGCWPPEVLVARRLAAIGTGVCASCDGTCDTDMGLCESCRAPRRTRVIEASNPYKKVWNSMEDEESTILDAVRNGTLFVPTPAILADRHRSTERHLRRQAEKQGPIIGRTANKDADTQAHLAASMDEYGQHINKLKRPSNFGFTVKEGN